MKLPLKDFCWHSEEEIKSFDIHNTPENGDIGYVMEVDLEYPPELHDCNFTFEVRFSMNQYKVFILSRIL
jgi:hypothetical protein